MQYSLKSVILVVSLTAVFCAIAAVFPPVKFAGPMAALLFVSLLLYMVAQGGMVLLGISDGSDVFPFVSTVTSNSVTPSMARALTTFLLSTLLLIAIYPLAREIGSSCSLLSLGIDGQTVSLDSEIQHKTQRLSLPDLWRILYVWGSVHVVKWTFFFALLTLFFGLTFTHLRDPKLLISRLLYFSPWIFVLHFLMLFGTWMEDPNISGPEDQGWHWECFMEPTWLKRLAIPIAIVGHVYFTYVLQVSSKYAILLALGTVPLAIMATVAANELGFFLI